MSTAPLVICVGISVYDYVWEVPGIPATPTKTTATGQRETGGGMAATAAAAIARLGGRAELWTRIGDDPAGAQLLDRLERLGVETQCVRRFAGARTPVATALVDPSGERLLAVYPGRDLPSDPGWLPLHRVESAAAVLADVRWLSGALALFEAARFHGVPSVLDADILPDPGEMAPLVAAADHVIFSQRGLAEFVGSADPGEALRLAAPAARGLVGVTLGAEGFLWREGSTEQRAAAYPVEARDTNGAGDVFHGAYALALANRYGTAEAARFAGAAAALKCARGNGWDGLPERVAVDALIREASDADVGR